MIYFKWDSFILTSFQEPPGKNWNQVFLFFDEILVITLTLSEGICEFILVYEILLRTFLIKILYPTAWG